MGTRLLWMETRAMALSSPRKTYWSPYSWDLLASVCRTPSRKFFQIVTQLCRMTFLGGGRACMYVLVWLRIPRISYIKIAGSNFLNWRWVRPFVLIPLPSNPELYFNNFCRGCSVGSTDTPPFFSPRKRYNLADECNRVADCQGGGKAFTSFESHSRSSTECLILSGSNNSGWNWMYMLIDMMLVESGEIKWPFYVSCRARVWSVYQRTTCVSPWHPQSN